MRTPGINARIAPLCLAAVALALVGAPVVAQPLPLFPVHEVGGPILIDGEGNNLPPRVAVAPNGDIVTVWADRDPGPIITSDTDLIAPAATATSAGILFQRAAPDGRPRGAIGEVTADQGETPAVAIDDAGAFGVTWAFAGRVYARLFAANGAARSAQLPVQELASGFQFDPQIALDAAGAFVVTWQGLQPSNELVPYRLFARRFDRDGGATSDAFTVAGPRSSQFQSTSVSMSGAGGFAAGWSESGSPSGVFAQLYAPTAVTPLRRTTLVTATNRVTFTVDLAMDDEGGAVAAWQSDLSEQIFAQRVAPNGVAEGTPINILASDSAYRITPPAVAADADGDFVVTWHDGSSSQIVSLRLTREGQRESQRLTIAESASTVYGSPDVAMDADGEFVVAWLAADDEGADDIWTQSYLRPAVLATQTGDRTQVVEGGASDRFSVALRTFPTAPVTVTLTPDQSQQLQLSQTQLSFAASVAATRPVSITVAAINDNIAEGPHTVQVRLSAAGPRSGYDTPPPLFTVNDVVSDTITVFVTDNDTANYSVSTSTAGTNEGSGTPVTFTIFRGGAIDGSNGIGYRFAGTATFGEDYTISSAPQGVSSADGVIPFAPRQDVQRITISIVDDQIGEPNSSIALELLAPLPAGSGRVLFPVAVVTLGDNDLAEVRVRQTDGSTRVVRGGASDEISVALRTLPTAPVQVILTPASNQLDLGAGWGAPLTLSFAPNQSAMQAQQVPVRTAGSSSAADLALGASIKLAASSVDGGYTTGARFTIDGRDSAELPVEIVVPPGSGPGILSVYLPLVAR